MQKNTLILLVGPSCSGKDTLLNQITSTIPSVKKLQLCTTREPREEEKGDPDIVFYTPNQYERLQLEAKIDSRSYKMYDSNGEMTTVFYTNLVPKELLEGVPHCDSTYIGITTLDGLQKFDKNKLITEYFDITAISLVVDEGIRIRRYINRVSKDKNSVVTYDTVKEILRRIDQDREDFSKERYSRICKDLEHITVWSVDGSRNLSVVTTDIKHVMINKMNKKETLKAIESILLKFKDDAAVLIRDRTSVDIPTYAKISSYPANLLTEIVKEVH